MRFKQFLEAQVGDTARQFDELDVQQAYDILNSKCKNALWMLHKNRPIWRGDIDLQRSTGRTGFSVFNADISTRKSQNTHNYYTLIFDNHPEMKDFPKRSKSLIASTDFSVASGYLANAIFRNPIPDFTPTSGEPTIIIPFDDSRIGATGRGDIWHISTVLFDNHDTLPQFNRFWKNSQMSDTDWDKWLKFDAEMKQGLVRNKRLLGLGFETYQEYFAKYENNFLETVFKAYSPKMTGMEAHTTATLDQIRNQEVWVGDKMLCVSFKMWQNLRAKV